VSGTFQQFGDYHLLERIATGGMAEVYRARAFGLAGFEKILVIKKVLPALARDDEFVRLFIDEAKIAVQLLHVNIVQVFELNEVNGHYYMALEYVHGLDLAKLAERTRKSKQPIPIALVLFVTAEVLKALAFAHARVGEDGEPLHIVHCDISPQNILVSFAGEVKITDFGISRAAFQAKSLHDTIRGKYAYMSPEQIEGQPLDGRSDLFSLGIVMFELLTGQRLFKAKSRDETIARVRRAQIPPLRNLRREITGNLQDLVLTALARNVEDRFASAAEMLEELNVLTIREGHRATNNDLAAYVRGIIETDHRPETRLEPSAVVVVAAEAVPPPRTQTGPRITPAALTQEWAGIASAAGAEVWEHSEGSMLLCWVGAEVKPALTTAIRTTLALKQATQNAGYKLSAGVAPGVARIDAGTHRPPDGWELAGPFYLARWMMNLSAHRGRPLLTEIGARHVSDEHKSELVGRISILGNRFIHLYEVG
jgi:eukaryotic-like serine/threonine-protein kinase